MQATVSSNQADLFCAANHDLPERRCRATFEEKEKAGTKHKKTRMLVNTEKMLQVRTTKEEREFYNKKAASKGTDLSDYIRVLIETQRYQLVSPERKAKYEDVPCGRTVRVTYRVTLQEEEDYIKIAKANGYSSLAKFVRMLIETD